MCSRLRGKIIIFFSYISVIAIGILIYLVVFLFAENRQNVTTKNSIDFMETYNPIRTHNLPQTSDSNATQNPTQDDNFIELPNEIDTAIDVIEQPRDSSEALKVTFPRDFIVMAKILNIRTAPNTQAKIMKRFKQGAIISISEIDGEWAKLEKGGFAYLPMLKERDF